MSAFPEQAPHEATRLRARIDAQMDARRAALLVTSIEGIETTAALLAERLGWAVEIASTRGGALRLLERRSFAVVVVDQLLADGDPEGAELVWRNAGLAIPLQFSFALAGVARLERELRAAVARRQREQQLAAAAAAAELDTELKNAVTSFLLESQMALAEGNLNPQTEMRLKKLVVLAGHMRERLSGASHGTPVG